ncbi:MAG: hypothetical protein JWR70_956 [Modestobacter sp.]|nr:hypothetical protein [Modestobacter sp.]
MRRKWSALVLFTVLSMSLFGVGFPTASAAAAVHAVSAGESAPVNAAVPGQRPLAQLTEVHFKNYTEQTVSVAIAFEDRDLCKYNGNIGTRGWWQIPPGGGVTHVLNTAASWVDFYAHSADGRLVWDGTRGTPGVTMLTNPSAFRSCLTYPHPGWNSVSTRYHYIGTGSSIYTIELNYQG